MNESNKNRTRPTGLGFVIPLILLAGCASQPVQVQPLPVLKDQAESMLLPKRINKIRMVATNFAMKAQMERQQLLQKLPTKEQVKRFVADFNACMLPQSKMVKQQFDQVLGHLHQSTEMLETGGITNFKEKIDAIKIRIGTKYDDPAKGFHIPHLNPEQSSLDQSMFENEKPHISLVLSGLQQSAASSRELLVEDYLKAYFGSVESIILNLDASDASGWTQATAEALQRRVDSPTVQKIVDEVTGELANNPDILKQKLKYFILPIPMKDPGFVSRDGTRYEFPGITFKGNQAEIDESQVGADVVRIIMEAIRDAYAPLPVVPNATVVSSISARGLNDIELFDPASSNWKVTAKDFMIIQGDANAVESAVASAVGKAIRGGSWGSLNNEALAKVIETAAGVFARHTVERAEWCVHKVKDEGDMPAMGAKP